jgi:hypothetical protein
VTCWRSLAFLIVGQLKTVELVKTQANAPKESLVRFWGFGSAVFVPTDVMCIFGGDVIPLSLPSMLFIFAITGYDPISLHFFCAKQIRAYTSCSIVRAKSPWTQRKLFWSGFHSHWEIALYHESWWSAYMHQHAFRAERVSACVCVYEEHVMFQHMPARTKGCERGCMCLYIPWLIKYLHMLARIKSWACVHMFLRVSRAWHVP